MDPVGNSFEVIDPSTEQVIRRLPAAGVEDTDRAVARAKAAFAAWRNVTAGDRATILRRVGASRGGAGGVAGATGVAQRG